jgi:DDE family transposase
MHVDVIRNHQKARDGSRREYTSRLLRRSYRDDQGRPRKETLANLSALPDEAVEAIRRVLRGDTLVSADESFVIERSVPHGDVAAVHAMASKLGLKSLLGPDCRERDLAYALVVSRVVRPRSKLSTLAWWADSSLGTDLGVSEASHDEVYAALDWLRDRQDTIEADLARRHLASGGIAMFDLSSSWVEGSKCPLAAFGHSRDGKRGRKQIEYGLLTGERGVPVAIRVFAGNTSDAAAFPEAVRTVRDDFGVDRMVFVGDRGMITSTRIKDLRQLPGAEWIGALKAPQIAAVARDDGPLQMSLFDVHNFAEFTHPDYPGERLIGCRNPVLAAERARKRAELLAATEENLTKIAEAVASGRVTGSDNIGVRVGKVINKHKVGKHFIVEITDDSLSWRRDEDKIRQEADLDGIYVIRTSLDTDTLNTADTITAYKNLAYVERDFRVIKVDDLDLRPVRHYLEERVRAHVFLCMLAAYLTWHLREALAELTFTDEHPPARTDPVAPAERSTHAAAKDGSKHTRQGLPVSSFRDLLDHLKTLCRETINFAGHRIDKLTEPTPRQRRAFELINSPIPLTLTP